MTRRSIEAMTGNKMAQREAELIHELAAVIVRSKALMPGPMASADWYVGRVADHLLEVVEMIERDQRCTA